MHDEQGGVVLVQPAPSLHLTQAAPLLKETLTDINWKDLEALRKIDTGG